MVELEFRSLVRVECIFNGEVVQAELLLDLFQQRLVRLMQADPYKPLGCGLYPLLDVIEIQVIHPSSRFRSRRSR